MWVVLLRIRFFGSSIGKEKSLVWGGVGGERMGGIDSLDCVGGVCVMNTETFRSNPLFSGLS